MLNIFMFNIFTKLLLVIRITSVGNYQYTLKENPYHVGQIFIVDNITGCLQITVFK